jgi:hypothetical protein
MLLRLLLLLLLAYLLLLGRLLWRAQLPLLLPVPLLLPRRLLLLGWGLLLDRLLRRCLRLPTLPRGGPTVTCFCGKALAATDSEHAHTCPTPNALRVLCHDELVEVVCCATRQGGVTSSKEPLLAALQSGPRTRLPRAKARRNILYVLTNELQEGDVCSVHPAFQPRNHNQVHTEQSTKQPKQTSTNTTPPTQISTNRHKAKH